MTEHDPFAPASASLHAGGTAPTRRHRRATPAPAKADRAASPRPASSWRPPLTVLPALATALLCVAPAFAADEPAPAPAPLPPWSDSAEFSFVLTAGNSEASTLGFKNLLLRRWEKSLLTVKAGAIRAESTTTTRTATGTPSDFEVHEDSHSDTTAENYYLNGQYDRKITDFFLWFAGAGWERNEPAGVQNRYIVSAGVGNIWAAGEKVKFKTNYGITGTKEDDVVDNPDQSDTFVGARVSYDYWHKFGANTVYISSLVVDDNLDETSDWRADMINSVAVSMNTRLALKVSLQWLYDNKPSLVAVPLNGGPDTVLTEADDLDTIFTASLVVNF